MLPQILTIEDTLAHAQLHEVTESDSEQTAAISQGHSCLATIEQKLTYLSEKIAKVQIQQALLDELLN